MNNFSIAANIYIKRIYMKGKKLTNEEFIKRVNELYDGKYDLSKANVNCRDEKGRVCIVCPIHGEFWKTPNNILLGHGCPKCAFEKMGKEKTQTTEWFINESNKIHNNKYDYSKIKYVGNRYNVEIICPIHGSFIQQAGNHLKGRGCKLCYFESIRKKRQKTTEQFIEEARKIHGDKYDYSKINYIKNNVKVCIICPEHGEFWQTPASHLNGNGCVECGKIKMSESKKLTIKNFIEKSKFVHDDKYDYSKVEYTHSRKKVCIICPIHGEFWQTPASHLDGSGCPKCADNQPINTEEFIKRSKEKHGELYDYSKSEYKNNRTKIEIICHKKDSNGIEHGSFFTTPHSHIQGSGCPKCKQNYRLENEVRLLLTENHIVFEEKKTFEGLKYKLPLKPDFYLPNENIIIECQGIQHYKPVDFGGNGKKYAMEQFKLNKERDKIKKNFCKENGIKLIEYSHLKIDDENVIKTKKKLLNEIKKNDRNRNKKA